VDLDLRKLRYFVAVAEELNFRRAAARLHIAQPVLSRQIRALETELHAVLLDRTQQSVELTKAGRQLLDDAGPLLTRADAVRRRVAVTARGPGTFTVGFMPGITVTAAVRAFATRHPDLTIDLTRTSWEDQTQAVRDGRVDVSYVRLPVDQVGLKLVRLFSDPRVAAVSADHRLAGKESVAITDLLDDDLLQDPNAVPEWRDAAPELRRGSRRTRQIMASVEEKLEHVAAGHGIAVLPQSIANFYTRPDVVYLDIDDFAPNYVCLAWDAARRSPLLPEFADIAAQAHATAST